MIYVIDANNLAGKLGLLEEDNFDELLLKEVDGYLSEKGNGSFLVFDSADPMGDVRVEGKISIVTAPRDGKAYTCADDKIVEIVKTSLDSEEFKDEITVVTDDIELKEKISNEAEERECQSILHLVSCSEFVEKVNKLAEGVNDDYFAPKDLDQEEEAEINEELRELWN